MHTFEGADSELPHEQPLVDDGTDTESIAFCFVDDSTEQGDTDGSTSMAAFDLPIGSGNTNPMAEGAEPANEPTDRAGEAPDSGHDETAQTAEGTSESDSTVGFVVYPHPFPYATTEWRGILAAGYEQNQVEFDGDSAAAAELLAAFDAGIDETHRYIAATQPENWKNFEKPTIGIVTNPDFMRNIAFTDGVSPVVYVGGRYLGRMTELGLDVDQVMTDMNGSGDVCFHGTPRDLYFLTGVEEGLHDLEQRISGRLAGNVDNSQTLLEHDASDAEFSALDLQVRVAEQHNMPQHTIDLLRKRYEAAAAYRQAHK